jgi:arylsulfatase A-like enzyme
MYPSHTKEIAHSSTRVLWIYALGLATLLFVGCLIPPAHTLWISNGGQAAVASIMGEAIPTKVLGDIAAYVLILWCLHALLGAGALCLAVLTLRAFPRIAASRQALLVAWFLLLSVCVVLTSAGLYPRSHLGDYYHAAAQYRIGPLPLFQLGWIIVGVLASVVIWKARFNRGEGHVGRSRPVIWGLSATILIAILSVSFSSSGTGAAVSDRPHVIILGIDSLRTDMVGRFGGDAMPALDAQLAEAFLFKDAITPLARTFPSWVSILTGKHPRTTGAWVNLIDRARVKSEPTIADSLRARGYRTVFATDEVRFANIDTTYGFEQIITPRIGATDFVLGTLNDTPVANLISNTRLGAVLFPNTHANRAVATLYKPNVFVERLRRTVAFDEPTLFVVHLTASHWPYDHGEHVPELHDGAGARHEKYLYGLKTSDSQVGEIFAWLDERQVLRNAIVWFISDHGEALGLPEDRLVSPPEGSALTVSAHGHGTSVLSPVQLQVLMAVKGYGRAAEEIPSGETSAPVSLEDLTPTTLALLDYEASPSMYDGYSLVGLLKREADDDAEWRDRVRFTETDFNNPRILAGEINPKWLAQHTAPYYTINARSGWVQLRDDRLDEILAAKERAAMKGKWVMAALPTLTQETLYVIANRENGSYQILSEEPTTPGVARELWDALHRRFPAELFAPKRVAESPVRTVESKASTKALATET